jgi:hypothetical protein
VKREGATAKAERGSDGGRGRGQNRGRGWGPAGERASQSGVKSGREQQPFHQDTLLVNNYNLKNFYIYFNIYIVFLIYSDLTNLIFNIARFRYKVNINIFYFIKL